MSKLYYIIGILKNIINPRISYLALVDNKSKIHKNARIFRATKIYNSNVGAYTYIGPKSEITHATIGKYCSIGRDCLIGLPNHSIKYLSTSPIFTSKYNALKIKWAHESNFKEFNDVKIANDVWIGSRVIVMGGVSIGNGAIIGAGAIVTKDIPDYAIAVGVPASIIKYRFDNTKINKLIEIQWWNRPEKILKSNIKLFNQEDIAISDLELLSNRKRK